MPAQSQESPVIRAIESIYAAALTPDTWPYALGLIADALGDVGAILIYQRDDGSYGTLSSPRLGEAQRVYAGEGWWRQDIRMGRAIERGYAVASASAITDRHVASEMEIVEHPFYRDFLLPQGLGWFAGISISPDPRVGAALSIQRARTKAPFSDEELTLVERLGRHVETALRLSIRLVNAELNNLALGEALSRVGVGVFLVDGLGRVVFSNSSADAFLGGALMKVAGRLSARGAEQDRALRAAFDAALSHDIATPIRPLLLRGPDSDSNVAVHVFPLTAQARETVESLFANAEVVVLALEANAKEHDPAIIRDLLGLTLGEARVASLVGAGLPPRAAAGQLGITEETARTVLKRVFAKTGVARQSELAALLTRLVLR